MTGLRDRLRVDPSSFRLVDVDPADDLGRDDDEVRLEAEALRERLRDLQTRLEAEEERSVLLIIQGMDASGKDETVKGAFIGLNPQAMRVEHFSEGGGVEEEHDFLWRFHQDCPRNGEIGVWNRSYYDPTVETHVQGEITDAVAAQRIRHVREFEHMLSDEGTTLLKAFMHVSSERQRRRLQDRVDDPQRHWEFDQSDLDRRARREEFLAAYEHALRETSSEWAPWYVVPADDDRRRDLAILGLLVETLEELDPQFPPPDPDLEGLTIE